MDVRPDLFQSLRITPSYAEGVFATWTPSYGVDGFVVAYVSPDGHVGWECVNAEDPAPYAAGLLEIPAGAIPEDRSHVPFIRLVLEDPDTNAVGMAPDMGLYGSQNRMMHGIARRMMQLELLHIRTSGGLEFLHYRPRTSGMAALELDEDTGQRVASCPGNTELDSYGEDKIGGYTAPFRTMLLISAYQHGMKSDDSGMGASDPRILKARMPAFPPPQPGDLLVRVPTDDRYVVGEQERINGFRFYGELPVVFEAALHLLPRGDRRYRLKVAESDLDWR